MVCSWIVSLVFPLANTSVSRLTGGIILKIVYGYTIEDKNDPFIHNADVAAKSFSTATSLGWLVDMIPSCTSCCFSLSCHCSLCWFALILVPLSLTVRHLPPWTPGAGFLRQAAAWRKEAEIMLDGPFDLFSQQMVSSVGSYARVCHAECPIVPLPPDAIRPQVTTHPNA